MGQIICHNSGRYNIYSSIFDRFRFVESINLEQLKFIIEKEQGTNGLSVLPERLERAHQRGHSSVDDGDLDDLFCCNRAGESETKLTTKECIKLFLS